MEGEEREYVLELLMREVPPNLRASVHPAKAELATLKGKRKRNLGKKLRKRLRMAKGAAAKEPKKEGKADAAEGRRGQATDDLSRKPRGQRRELDWQEARREEPAYSFTADLRRGVFRIASAGIFPRSSLLGAGQLGFWEFGEGGSVG